MDVMLVYMPYGPIERPSLALSLFKPLLERAGRSVEIRYLTFDFAERIGSRTYWELSWVREEMIAEWTFSAAAFPDFAVDHEAYLRRAAQTLAPGNAREARMWAEDMAFVRNEASRFIEEVALEIAAARPRILACSSTFNQHCPSLALIRAVKRMLPEVVTVMGGANCDGEMAAATMEICPELDYAVSGEADLLFVDLCEQILDRGMVHKRGVPGLYCRSAAGVAGTGRAQFDALDDSPMPDFDDYFRQLRLYPQASSVHPGLLIETSRGCWWGQVHHCTFCGLNGGGMEYRRKSPERAVQEFIHLAERYDLHRMLVVDNILDSSYYQTVLPRLAQERIPLNLMYEIKSNVKLTHLQALRDAGVVWIQPGIESLHDDVLKIMDKGVSALTNVQLLLWARSLGLRVLWNFLCDFPGEEDAWYWEMAEWLPLIEHLEPPKDVRPIRFDRFSPYQMRPANYGLRLKPGWPYGSVYPGPESLLARLAYIFEDETRAAVVEDLMQGPVEGSMRALPGPGRDALRERVMVWRSRHESDDPPLLVATSLEHETHILDTRTVAPERETTLSGLEHLVHRAATVPAPVAALRTKVEAPGHQTPSEEEVRQTAEALCRRKLLLRFGDRYLSMALPAMPPQPGTRARDKGFPGGWVAHEMGEGVRQSFRPLDRERAKLTPLAQP